MTPVVAETVVEAHERWSAPPSRADTRRLRRQRRLVIAAGAVVLSLLVSLVAWAVGADQGPSSPAVGSSSLPSHSGPFTVEVT
jgi:hypothetical protein